MTRGLQVTMTGDELRERISQRLRMRAEKASALEERIKRREGDQPYDVRPDDGLETLGELVDERDLHHRRISELTLFRDRLAAHQRVTLGLVDLRAADLVDSRSDPAIETIEETIGTPNTVPIDGLKLTVVGYVLHRLLRERIESHNASAESWRREAARTPAEETDEEPLLPEPMCEHEAERHEWRASVLSFLREHLDPAEVYRLGPADLEFGELLPATPVTVEQAEYEERTRVGFSLERMAKRMSGGIGWTPSAG